MMIFPTLISHLTYTGRAECVLCAGDGVLRAKVPRSRRGPRGTDRRPGGGRSQRHLLLVAGLALHSTLLDASHPIGAVQVFVRISAEIADGEYVH